MKFSYILDYNLLKLPCDSLNYVIIELIVY